MTPAQKAGLTVGGATALCGAVLLGVFVADAGPAPRPVSTVPAVTAPAAPSSPTASTPTQPPPTAERAVPPPTQAGTRAPSPRRTTPRTAAPPPATPGPGETEPVTGAGYDDCAELREDYLAGVPAGHPAYELRFDRDRDGWACEVEVGQPRTSPAAAVGTTVPAATPTTPRQE